MNWYFVVFYNLPPSLKILLSSTQKTWNTVPSWRMNLPALSFGICSAAVVLSRMICDSMVSALPHTRQSMLLRICPDRMFASGRCVASIRWMPKARPWRAMIESRFSIRPILSFCSFVKPVLSSTSATSSQAKIWRCRGTTLRLL